MGASRIRSDMLHRLRGYDYERRRRGEIGERE